MAEKKNTPKGDSGTTRRGFIGAIGAAAVASAVPLPALAVTPRSWLDAAHAHVAALRAAYLAEVARFAETLRPRFESGELRAFNERIDERDKDLVRAHRESPHWALERVVERYFGLEVTTTRAPDGWEIHEGDGALARIIIAASPHGHCSGDGWDHECYQAVDAATWDVIAHARAQGWYTPAADECEDPAVFFARQQAQA